MTAHLSVEPHLDDEETEHGSHHDQARHGRVDVGEQVRETGVHEAAERSREQLGCFSCQLSLARCPKGKRNVEFLT